MKQLVCGGAGFIGSNYIRRVLRDEKEVEVTCFDKLTSVGSLENLESVAGDPRFTFVRGDICDQDAVVSAFESAGGFDAIVNFAAETHVDKSIDDPENFLKTDVMGTHVLLELMRTHGVGRMVQVSTDEVYGPIADGSATEEWPMRPSNPYAASKAGGDLQALAYHRTFGLDVMITRGCNTYGPHQYPDSSSFLQLQCLLWLEAGGWLLATCEQWVFN